MEAKWNLLAFLLVFILQCPMLHAHREHKVHNIVLYPDKQSWCKTTPIKQVVTWPQCSSLELDNNICVGACFSYMVPHSEPSAPGDLIRPYCDSCQPSDSIWHPVNLECKDDDNGTFTMLKTVQIITNCSCSSCVESSKIKSDYNSLLHSLADDDDNVEKSVNENETPDLLLNPNFNSVKNNSKDGIEANERFLKLFKEFRHNEKLEEINEKELFTKFEEKVDLEKIRELLHKYSKEEHEKAEKDVEKHHHVKQHELLEEASEEGEQVEEQVPAEVQKVEQAIQEEVQTTQQPRVEEKLQLEPQHQHHHHHHRGPHHSIVLDSDVKEKIDVEPHYLHPAVAGQEISYHDNIVVPDKNKKEDLI